MGKKLAAIAREDFPELKEKRFGALPYETRKAVGVRLMPYLTQMLTARGPLEVEGACFFFLKDHGLRFFPEEMEAALYDNEAFEAFKPHGGPHGVRVYRTLAQAARDEQPHMHLPEHYPTAYFELLAYIALVRAHPEYVNAPIEQLRKLDVL